jgi:hypothetical protein
MYYLERRLQKATKNDQHVSQPIRTNEAVRTIWATDVVHACSQGLS